MITRKKHTGQTQTKVAQLGRNLDRVNLIIRIWKETKICRKRERKGLTGLLEPHRPLTTPSQHHSPHRKIPVDHPTIYYSLPRSLFTMNQPASQAQNTNRLTRLPLRPSTSNTDQGQNFRSNETAASIISVGRASIKKKSSKLSNHTPSQTENELLRKETIQKITFINNHHLQQAAQPHPILSRSIPAAQQLPFYPLGPQIFQLVLISTPSPQVIQARERLVYQIQHLISRSRIGRRPVGTQPYMIQVFGSISFGLDSLDSDLDLCILDPDRPQGLTQTDVDRVKFSLPKIYNVRALSHIFINADFKDVKPIPMARTPILKFRSPNGIFSVDLNCNNLLGCQNSKLIRSYYELSPLVFRPLALVIKKWAKARGYCDPSGSQGPISASSYTLVLLLIAYLQVINHLPNLQDPLYIQQVYGDSKPDLIYIKNPARKPKSNSTPYSPLIAINTSFVVSPPDASNWIQTYPTQSYIHDPAILHDILEKILVGFFEFYDRFDFDSYLISIRDGRPIRRRKQPEETSDDGVRKGESMDRLLASLKNDLSHNKTPIPSCLVDDEEEEEDQITYTPFSCREGVSETVQRELDSNTLSKFTQDGGSTGTERSLHPSQDHDDPSCSASSSSVSSSSSHDHNHGSQFNRDPTLLEWTHPMVVVDPFLYERNTAGNIKLNVRDEIRDEFARAHRILKSGGSLADLFSL
ncbi:hypothetical protein PSTG_02701 [Puccinia striiformis f. sp. tritici PST-78]|uniref:polynucleotide adenylyltransferase n=1 Tax=Puccinia striiformis f. sp. tritici PST-78 TaxID=1165861 RepID=A0A0L0VXL1_9BASI|nr:hypothetical protein PSTG_02701 [Puccinia striiformis f. sp. tritici PST-78]